MNGRKRLSNSRGRMFQAGEWSCRKPLRYPAGPGVGTESFTDLGEAGIRPGQGRIEQSGVLLSTFYI